MFRKKLLIFGYILKMSHMPILECVL